MIWRYLSISHQLQAWLFNVLAFATWQQSRNHLKKQKKHDKSFMKRYIHWRLISPIFNHTNRLFKGNSEIVLWINALRKIHTITVPGDANSQNAEFKGVSSFFKLFCFTNEPDSWKEIFATSFLKCSFTFLQKIFNATVTKVHKTYDEMDRKVQWTYKEIKWNSCAYCKWFRCHCEFARNETFLIASWHVRKVEDASLLK